MNLQLTRKSNNVRRYHTETLIKEETVGQHCANVAATIIYLYKESSTGLPSAPLLMSALQHDVSEVYTGDVPAPAKWGNPLLDAQLRLEDKAFRRANDVLPFFLTQLEYQVFKFADIFDVLCKCDEENSLGNDTLHEMRQRAVDAAIVAAKDIPDVKLRTAAVELLELYI